MSTANLATVPYMMSAGTSMWTKDYSKCNASVVVDPNMIPPLPNEIGLKDIVIGMLHIRERACEYTHTHIWHSCGNSSAPRAGRRPEPLHVAATWNIIVHLHLPNPTPTPHTYTALSGMITRIRIQFQYTGLYPFHGHLIVGPPPPARAPRPSPSLSLCLAS